MKYFFTAGVGRTKGSNLHSAESVRHKIKKLVEIETPDGVLSDDRIVEILKADRVDVARRTVAKYRVTMHIPSFIQRRRERSLRA